MVSDSPKREAWLALKAETAIDYATEHAMQPMPIATGIAPLDDRLNGGLPRGLVTVLAGEAGCGKSAMACVATYNAAKSNAFPVYFSIEMPEQMVVSRMLAIHTAQSRAWDRARGVPENQLVPQVWWSTTRNVVRQLAGRMPRTVEEAEAYVAEHGSQDPVIRAWADFERTVWQRMAVVESVTDIDEVCDRTERLCEAGLRPLVVVDYLQMGCDGGEGSEYERVTRAIGKLAALAKRWQIAVLCISGMRNIGRDERRETPTLSMLRSSGRIGFDAGVVLVLRRSESQDEGASRTNVECHVVKSRVSPPTGQDFVPLQFNGGMNMFE